MRDALLAAKVEHVLMALAVLGASFLCRRRRTSSFGGCGADVSLLAEGDWNKAAPRYTFPEEVPRCVGDWQGVERIGSYQKVGRAKSCEFFQLPSAMPTEDVARILDHVKHKAAYSVDSDSVDSCATFEYYPFRAGSWTDEALRRLLSTFIDDRLLPYVRERYSCKSAALADILVRRYVPGERRTHAVHFDGQALVTGIFGLCDPCEYEGGLYVQPEAHGSSRMFFRIEPGDLLVHSFDLQHGVFVWSGVRYSMVFWIKDSPESVRKNTSPWYDSMARDGDADAMFNIAQDFELGMCGRPLDLKSAETFYQKSADMGHHFAQYSLSKLLYTAHRHDADPQGRARAAFWLRKSAEQGFALAQKDFALALVGGQGVEEDAVQAAAWMRRAAEQLDLEAACYLGGFLAEGLGAAGAADLRAAARWYGRSAEGGFPEAQYELGMMCLQGQGVPWDADKARYWLGCAAKQGHRKAAKAVGRLTTGSPRKGSPRKVK